MQSFRQWRADILERASIGIYSRFRSALRDTKHYALRELTSPSVKKRLARKR